jgi:hypothetical protein
MLFLFSKLKERKWKRYSAKKRLKILQALEAKVAKSLKLEPLELVVREDDGWNCFGAYAIAGDKQHIVINSKLLTEPLYRFHAMETIAHETRHAYQNTIVKKDLKWYQFKAKKWKANWQSYFSSSVDNVMYTNQAVERDAQKYSIDFLRKHKYLDREYKLTYQAVLDRYNQAEIDAKKEYGIFYKFKIERNIKKNSKIKRY